MKGELDDKIELVALGFSIQWHCAEPIRQGLLPTIMCRIRAADDRLMRFPKKFVEVGGVNIAYVEIGDGMPVVFQHGNPTSSYLWRKIMPALANQFRCIALDLLGMGDSDKLAKSTASSYGFQEQFHYFELALNKLVGRQKVVFVVHDWGSALAFHWCRIHPRQVRGICYMEALVRQLTWDEWPVEARRIFQGFRSEAGEEMILEKNLFVERVLPGSVLSTLAPEVMDEYRRPFLRNGEARRPTLTWPRQIPIEGAPSDVCEIADRYSDWLRSSVVPKLFINAAPGAILTGSQREFCRSWANQTEITVNAGHFVPEDAPTEVAKALTDWLRDVPKTMQKN